MTNEKGQMTSLITKSQIAMILSLFCRHAGEEGEHGLIEGREIAGLAAGDQIAVFDNLLIEPLAAGIADIILNRVVTREPSAADHISRNQEPGRVTDDGHGLAGKSNCYAGENGIEAFN